MSANAQADEQAIRKLIDDWMQASARGDLDAVLSMMSDDVVFMTAGREPFGKQEFAAQSAGMKDVRIEGVARPVEIKVLGDWAWLRNHISVTITPKAGQPMKRAGYTLTILNRRPDGRWVITRDANLMPGPG
ncbi:MAG TPA: SgcJ/EcaC family oxidoreductase [Steroidobacteraceae bacterium]|nr:SgcJ/EcaC family oxidoreductase [Steroidobacteraceae bacterium]